MARADVESKIDDLYRGPLDAFTAARNALAKTLGGDDAARVRALKKPSLVPWAVNQLYWRDRPAYDRAIASGQELRKAQIAALKGRSADVRAATEEHRRAIADAVQKATQFAAENGSNPSRDALMRTFEALSLSGAPPAEPGRLTEPLQPAGFEALAGVTPVAARVAARQHVDTRGSTTARAHVPKHAGADHRAGALETAREQREEERRRAAAEKKRLQDERERQAEAKHRQLEIRKAEAAIERARAAEAMARERFERAQRDVRAAEQRLHQLKSAT